MAIINYIAIRSFGLVNIYGVLITSGGVHLRIEVVLSSSNTNLSFLYSVTSGFNPTELIPIKLVPINGSCFVNP
jgi:hypothetical protein